jgi:hypothetical protein
LSSRSGGQKKAADVAGAFGVRSIGGDEFKALAL